MAFRTLSILPVLFLVNAGIASAKPTFDPSSDAKKQAAQNSVPLFLAKVQGPVTVLRDSMPVSISLPQALEANDEVVTGDKGTADLEFQNGGIVEEGPNSDSTVSELQVAPDTFRARFLLAVGHLMAQVKKLTSSSSSCFEINAGGVVSGVRGTVFGVSYDKDSKQVTDQTFEGTIYAKFNGKEQDVDAGKQLVVSAAGVAVVSALAAADQAAFNSFLDGAKALQGAQDQMMNQLKQKLNDSVQNQLNHGPNNGHNQPTGSGIGIGGFHIGF